ncbi:hypothetical protein SLITO_v1c07170 [Spiroplasma litorale]|uniref:Uncharacterized protein n=1 Tax=Spiroplasma litorale TaxID=216942 RepID=A0A0K1W2N5_9MOLU|nr:hypothetical protein [Spiroplasma litorale]AKX34342.1 hypothetical protein SLITO_v1c07170 [Spiroplasma litorale]
MKKILTFLISANLFTFSFINVISCSNDEFGYNVNTNKVYSTKNELISYGDKIYLFFILGNYNDIDKTPDFQIESKMI